MSTMKAEEFNRRPFKVFINLGNLIRQHALFGLPMELLCRPDRTGIKEVSLYGPTQKKNCQSTPG